jgi:hypothetical protein
MGLFHVRNIREQLVIIANPPSNGETAAHTSWVFGQALGIV